MKKLLLFTLALIGGISTWGVDRTAITDASDFTNALSTGGSYILSNSISVSNSYTVSTSVDIDLNGNTITCTKNAGVYFITCSTKGKTIAFSNGTITMSNGLWGTFDCEGDCSINLNKVTINNSRSDGKHNIYCSGNGTKTFTECEINASGCGGISIGSGSATVDNCTITLTGASSNGKWRNSCVAASGGATVTVNEGTYTSDYAAVFINTSGGTINLNGGQYTSNSTSTPAAGSYNAVIFNEGDKGAKDDGNYQYIGKINISGGTFNGYLYMRSNTKGSSCENKYSISKGVFKSTTIYQQSGDWGTSKFSSFVQGQTTYNADNMCFVDYTAYTGSTIATVTPYDDFATANAATATENKEINLLTAVTISANTTIENRTITPKGDFDALTVTGGTLTVQGTTTITANGEYNAVNVNGDNAKLIVPENQDNVTIGKMTETSGEITLYAGTYNQDITAFLPTGYEQDPTTGKVKKSTPAEPYTRSGLTVGAMGTICLNQAVEAGAFSGAIFYKTAYREGTSKIFFDAVDALEAGKAYIFEATDTELSCTLSGTAVADPIADNGLYGTFEGINYSADPVGQASKDDETLKNMYLINNNTVRLCGKGCWLAPNRAYINLNEVSTKSTPAPGRRISLVNNDANTATFVEEVGAAAQGVKKAMINGQLIIMKDGKMFNAQGAEL